jgi:hypothetical protein
MNPAGHGPAAVVERLLEAVNAHDLEAMVALFADDYRNETPAHPQRGFRGNQQVRRNWTQLFAGVPDLRARLPGAVVDGDSVWTDWDISVAGHPRWCSSRSKPTSSSSSEPPASGTG